MRHGRLTLRLAAAALVLGIHAAVLMLLLADGRSRPPAVPPGPQFVSLWLDVPEPPPPAPAPLQVSPRKQRARPSPAPAPEPLSPAITQESEARGPPVVDWQREAAIVARQHASPRGEPTFGKPLPEQHKPCRVKPWKWKPEPKRAGIAPLPYVVLGRCVVGLGFFGCALGEPAAVDTSQLDDYLKGDGAGPSVPDPDVCD